MRRAITNRKGQAAIEFISTYGFAFMALMITLAAINYLGFFNPSALRSQSCSLPRGLGCNDYTISVAAPPVATGSAAHLQMNVTNEYNVNITVTSITFISNLFPTPVSCSANLPAANWPVGQSKIFWCPITPALYYPGEFYEGAVTVTFSQVTGIYVHTVAGQYSIRAQ